MVADRGRVTDGARSAGSDAARRRAHMPEGTSAILDTRSLATAHRRLAALLRPGLSVLDVGCGTGAITRGIAETVGPEGRVVGVDVNASMIDKARAAHRGVPGLSFEVADVAGRAGGGRGARVAGRQAHHAAVRARPWRFRHDGSVDAAQPPALDHLDWCDCASARVTMRLIPSRRGEPVRAADAPTPVEATLEEVAR